MWESLKPRFLGGASKPYQHQLPQDMSLEEAKAAFGEPKRKYLRPPIVIRNYGSEQSPTQETDRQFAVWGWCSGINTNALIQVYHAISMSFKPGTVVDCFNYRLEIANGRFHVRMQSIIEDPDEEYQGPRMVYMYMPGNVKLEGKSFPTCPIFGGPTELGLNTAKSIGLALNLKIVAMEHDVKDGLLVVYRTMDPTMQLDKLRETWTP